MVTNMVVFIFALILLKTAEGTVEESTAPICIPRIKTFSSNDQHYFYKCKKPGDLAVYTKCPDHQFYLPEKEACYEEQAEETSGRTRRSATTAINSNSQKPKIEDRQILGPVILGLGDLYDAKTDRFLAGTSLWSEKTIQAAKRTQNQLSSVIKYGTGRTLYEKLEEMNIKASLKLSFLGGLISIAGGAEFYRESSVLDNEEVFNAVYETKTHSEVLPMGTKKEFINLCASKDATHVVSQILYGQRGYLTFKHQVSKSSETQNISGYLRALVEKAMFSIKGEASVDLKGNEKKLAETTQTSISGDFVLDTMPTSFTEAIQAFKRLASANGKAAKNIKVKPIRVQLTPLWKYCDKSTTILMRISATMLDETSKVLNNLEKLLSKVKTLLATEPARSYSAVAKNLLIYKGYLEKYIAGFNGKLQTILPLIRGSKGKSEADLNQLISGYLSSPVQSDKSSQFLSRRNREIRAIQNMLDIFDVRNQNNLKVADYESANDIDISLRYPHLTVLSVNILQPKTITESFINGTEIDESNFWFNDIKAVVDLGHQIRLFKKFAEVNKANRDLFYLVKITKKSSNPATVTAIARRRYIAFTIPTRPDKPQFVSRDHNSITIKINIPTNSYIKRFYVSYWNVAKGEVSTLKTNLLDISNPIITLRHLDPAAYYQYRIIHYTEFGDSPSSIAGDVILTSPSSPPTNLTPKNVLEDQITITWRRPVHTGINIKIIGYKVFLYRKELLIEHKNLSQDRFETTFQNLTPAETYNVTVLAVAHSWSSKMSASESDEIALTVITLPRPPAIVNLISASLYSVNITWNVPTIADNAQIIECIVRVNVLNNNGSKAVLGTEKTQSSLTLNQATVRGLSQDTTYGIRIKIKTTMGASGYSSVLIVKTASNSTDLEKLRNSIESNVVMPKINAIMSVIANNQKEIKTNQKEIKTNQKKIKGNERKHTWIEDKYRYLMQTNSGLLPFGTTYGDVQKSRGGNSWYTINSDVIIKNQCKTLHKISVSADGIIKIFLLSNSSDLESYFRYNTGIVHDWFYFRENVTDQDRKPMDVDINRYLHINRKPSTFISTAALLLTFHHVNKVITYQLALVTDGVQMYLWTNFQYLEDKVCKVYWPSIYDCTSQLYISHSKPVNITSTSNIGVNGRHVMPAMTC